MSKPPYILHGKGEFIKFEISVGQFLLNQLSMHGDRVAQVNAQTNKRRTFEYILNASQKLAIYLQKQGLNLGDKVAICSENSLEFCIPVCAALYLGATVCPLSPFYTEKELKHTLNISKPQYIFISNMAIKTMMNMFKELHWSPKVIILAEYSIVKSWKNVYKIISKIPDSEINQFQVASIDIDNHVTAIFCSSGTTGLPKGVTLTNKNFITVLSIMATTTPQDIENSTSLAVLPFFHIYSFMVMLIHLIAGNTNIVFSRFDEKLFLECIEKYKIEQLYLVPSLVVFLAKHPLVDKYDLSSVKRIWSGAAPLSKETQEAIGKRLNIFDIRQGYGLTETTLGVLSSSHKTKPGSVGVLVPGISAKVIPLGEYETDETLGPYREGELCFKGDLIMKGYYNNEKSTRATIDKDGWLHTGDVGYYDDEEYFYVVDRIKELIKYKGHQVPPAELEGILLTSPDIKDAAVIGVPNEDAGELPMAFVVKQENSSICEKDVIQYVNERVSYPKRLRGGVKFIDSIPRVASGKILRRKLRDSLISKL